MNTDIVTLDPVVSPINAKTILAREGFHCSLITLPPGEHTPVREAGDVEEHILFVVDGEATVHFGELNTMLNKEEAILIPKGQAHVVSSGPNGGAKLLRVDFPPRQTVTPQILSFGN